MRALHVSPILFVLACGAEEPPELGLQVAGLTVHIHNDEPDIWPLHKKYHLDYCVSNEFGIHKALIVAALQNATAEWEKAAEVHFVYDSAQDGNCTNRNNNVVFNVENEGCGTDCLGRSFFPHEPREDRELLLPFSGSALQLTMLQGVVLHELGHTLGFRHEHIWTSCLGESSSGAELLTDYDEASVMHYRAPCAPDRPLELTARDKLGAACMYNRSMGRAACSPDSNSRDYYSYGHSNQSFTNTETSITGTFHYLSGDFDGDGVGDLFAYGRGYIPDTVYYGNGDETYAEVSVQVNDLFDPFSGDFDGDGRDDIFFYAPTSRTDWLWFGNANRTFGGYSLAVDGAYLPVSGDFDGNGKDDIYWFSPTGNDSIWWAERDRTFSTEPRSLNGDYWPAAGDFDNDGNDDIYWLRPGAPGHAISYGRPDRSFTNVSQVWAASKTVRPIIGNFDGQHGDDILWYDAGAGADIFYWSTGTWNFLQQAEDVDQFYQPRVADFDRNGVDDIFWYAPSL
jgi:hypothetical protein